ncbi:unnamed protein product, partial [Ectocarpus sp. 8 AP-2014]
TTASCTTRVDGPLIKKEKGCWRDLSGGRGVIVLPPCFALPLSVHGFVTSSFDFLFFLSLRRSFRRQLISCLGSCFLCLRILMGDSSCVFSFSALDCRAMGRSGGIFASSEFSQYREKDERRLSDQYTCAPLWLNAVDGTHVLQTCASTWWWFGFN